MVAEGGNEISYGGRAFHIASASDADGHGGASSEGSGGAVERSVMSTLYAATGSWFWSRGSSLEWQLSFSRANGSNKSSNDGHHRLSLQLVPRCRLYISKICSQLIGRHGRSNLTNQYRDEEIIIYFSSSSKNRRNTCCNKIDFQYLWLKTNLGFK